MNLCHLLGVRRLINDRPNHPFQKISQTDTRPSFLVSFRLKTVCELRTLNDRHTARKGERHGTFDHSETKPHQRTERPCAKETRVLHSAPLGDPQASHPHVPLSTERIFDTPRPRLTDTTHECRSEGSRIFFPGCGFRLFCPASTASKPLDPLVNWAYTPPVCHSSESRGRFSFGVVLSSASQNPAEERKKKRRTTSCGRTCGPGEDTELLDGS
ncbi:hypothetical protein SAMN05444851_1013 [Aliiroseovarius sediminilitoris]|uniref:Uncharacterized protein n=1 Tax=Aliiroseovarius sediminilitoris TaxID=1173584 RepID=A0A1I0NQ82_9RHOB|nr:hypothetical protein SAMN05444851_1013 [Aliiroseovarius sediminilitoris]